jgi:hypothetical protein
VPEWIGRGAMRWAVLATAGLALSACASSEIKVRCDKQLQPINPPASKQETQKGGTASPAPVDVSSARAAP